MRSSKSRSRSKANRPRTLGNIVNRVFDSSGPEGKVRGTPQQIIEKYQFLARDAQLSNDRVAAENFSQHAEHYTRMLGEAMREMAAEQESRRPPEGGQRRDDRDWQGQGYAGGNANGNGGNANGNGNGGGYGRNDQRGEARPDDRRPDDRREDRRDFRADPRNDQRSDPRPDPRPDQRGEARNDARGEGRGDYRADASRGAPQPAATEVIDLHDDGYAGLVETPEARIAPPARPDPRPGPAPEPATDTASDAPAEAKPDRGARRPRGPRKPRESAEGAGAETPSADPDRRAAE